MHYSRLSQPRQALRSCPGTRPVETCRMNYRIHPKYKTKYRVTNWSEYDQALAQRGSITVWISPAAIKGWKPKPSGLRGAPHKYSDLAIETALALRLVFHLPLRQTEGFLNSLFEMMDLDLPAPDHTTLSRRSKQLNVKLRRIPTKGAIHLIVDSRGLSIVGEGEWAAAKYGKRGKRGWKKLHLGVDEAGMVVAQELTDSTTDDAGTGLRLIDSVKPNIKSFTGDAAYRHARNLRCRIEEGSEGCCATIQDGGRFQTRTAITRTRQNDSENQQSRQATLEEGVRLSSTRDRRECVLQVQANHGGPTSCSSPGCSEIRSRRRVQRAESDARSWANQVTGASSLKSLG